MHEVTSNYRLECGSVTYLMLAARMIFWTTQEKIRAPAIERDEGKFVAMGMMIVAVIVFIGAIK